MEKYIEHFNQKVAAGETVRRLDEYGQPSGEASVYDVEWKFQDEELEHRYAEFKARRDQELHV
jgi:hypothetical protein